MDFSLLNRFSCGCSAGMVRVMRRFVRLAGMIVGKVCLAALQATIASVVFTTCAIAVMYYLGIPVPGPDEVLDKLESLGRLARILY